MLRLTHKEKVREILQCLSAEYPRAKDWSDNELIVFKLARTYDDYLKEVNKHGENEIIIDVFSYIEYFLEQPEMLD